MIVHKHKDGGIAIMVLAPGADKEDAIQKFRDCHPGEYLEDYVELDDAPEDRTFRDAWELHKSGKIVVNEHKAAQIHLKRIRHARDKELDRLDREQLRYLKDEAKLQEIEDKKQVLRDIPQTFKGLDINNPDWPVGLPKE